MEIESCFVLGSLDGVAEVGRIMRRVIGCGVWRQCPASASTFASSIPKLDGIVEMDVAIAHAVK
jgi:hypothetical protein